MVYVPHCWSGKHILYCAILNMNKGILYQQLQNVAYWWSNLNCRVANERIHLCRCSMQLTCHLKSSKLCTCAVTCGLVHCHSLLNIRISQMDYTYLRKSFLATVLFKLTLKESFLTAIDKQNKTRACKLWSTTLFFLFI